MVLIIDGKTRTISQKELVGDTVSWSELPIKTLFRKHTEKGERPQFDINLNFYDQDILGKIPVTYTLPDANLQKVVIDLNFYDFERKTKNKLGKRLVFDKGTLTIHELSKEKIRFDFDGEVHELMNDESRSVVSGSVAVSY